MRAAATGVILTVLRSRSIIMLRAAALSVATLAVAALSAVGSVGCTRVERSLPPEPVEDVARVTHHAPPPPSVEPTACEEVGGAAWPRVTEGASGFVTTRNRHLVQVMRSGEARELSFVGGHAFDLLNKLHTEAASDEERRRVVCAVLNDAAVRGVPVVRLWGSLKRTGSSAEVAEAARLLALVFDENARRSKPLRFVVTLLNHQAGYGAPDPTRTLDDQQMGPWHAPALYLAGGWKARGVGSLGERIATYGRAAGLASPYVLAWELVNELDTFRHIDGGRFDGEGAATLRDGFLVPAAKLLASVLPQPVMLGDLRGDRDAYAAWAPSVLTALPSWVRQRVIWTSHVYAERDRDEGAFLGKLDVDLSLAEAHGIPFVLGELGQHVPGARTSFCGESVHHDLGPLLQAVRARGVRALLIWGEGRCGLEVGRARRITIGAGSDSAEIGAGDRATHQLLRRTRAAW